MYDLGGGPLCGKELRECSRCWILHLLSSSDEFPLDKRDYCRECVKEALKKETRDSYIQYFKSLLFEDELENFLVNS
jgi:hypothetical protein